MSPLFAKPSGIDRETVIDVTVNAIPMGILLFFIVLFSVVNPFGYDLPMLVMMHGLTVIPFVLLGILTYISARVISRDEALITGEADESETRSSHSDEASGTGTATDSAATEPGPMVGAAADETDPTDHDMSSSLPADVESDAQRREDPMVDDKRE